MRRFIEMLRGTKTRRADRAVSKGRRRAAPAVESLQDRLLMAGNIFTAGGIVDVEGTSGNDTVTLTYNFNSPYTVADDSWTFDLNSDGVHVTKSIPVFALKQIDFNGYAGNDSLDAGQVGVPVWATGGLGNDSLVGGWGADYLDGGAGVDNMSGEAGVDVIIVSYYGSSPEGLWTQN